jgi:oligopeptide transport system substrate-binding protein
MVLKKIVLLFAVALISQTCIAKSETVFRRALGAEPHSIELTKVDDVPAKHILDDLYEGLVLADKDGQPIPGVALKWDISDDGKTYTFYLRENAKWSNGDRVTAHDFVIAWQRMVDPKSAATYAFILNPILNAQEISSGKIKDVSQLGVKAEGDFKLVATLAEPTPYFIQLMLHQSLFPFHMPSYEKYGSKAFKPGNFVTNGAYKLTKWVPQEIMVADKNKYYWDAPNVQIDKVEYHPIDDQNAAFKKYRAGGLDYLYNILSEKIPLIKKDSKLSKEFHVTPSLAIYYYGFNLEDPVVGKNKELREALSLVVDRELITEKVTRAGQIPAYNFVPPEAANYYDSQSLDFKDWPMKKRIARAKELYKKAGYSAKKPLKVEFTYNTDENHKKIAIAVASMWKNALGVQVALRNMEWKVFLQKRQEKKEMQIFRSGWLGDYNDPFNFLEINLGSTGAINDMSYVDKNYDKYVIEASVTNDLRQRSALLGKAEKIFLDSHAVIPLFFYVDTHMVKPYVKGFHNSKKNLLHFMYAKDLEIIRK